MAKDNPKKTTVLEPEYEIWVEINGGADQSMFGEARIGVAYVDSKGVIYPQFAAFPGHGVTVSFRPCKPGTG